MTSGEAYQLVPLRPHRTLSRTPSTIDTSDLALQTTNGAQPTSELKSRTPTAIHCAKVATPRSANEEAEAMRGNTT